MRRVVYQGAVPRIERLSDATRVQRETLPRVYVDQLLVDCRPGELVWIADEGEPALLRPARVETSS